MSAAADVARMLALVPWLLERPGAHVDEAAAALGTDRATVLDDLSTLQFCGLPGRLGGDLFEVELVGDRVLLRLAPAFERPLRPTPVEALRLVLALDTVATALGDRLPGLHDAVATLRRAAGVPAGVVAAPDAGDAWLGPLREAAEQQRAVRLRYRGRGEDEASEREVEPWELVLHRGRWYLQAHDRDRGAARTFLLARVQAVAHLDGDGAVASTARPATPPPLPAWRPGEDDVEVRLRVAPAGRWVLAALDHVEVVEEQADGGVVVTVPTDAPSFVVQLVLSARGDVVVERPARVREAVRDRARRGLAAVRGDGPARRSGAD